MELTIEQILSSFPLRVGLTDYCNAACIFCSNEGMGLDQRNVEHLNLEDFSYLISLFKEKGLNHVALTGGDPSLYPRFREMLQLLKEVGIERQFMHTNGIALKEDMMRNELKGLTKLGVSVHAFDYSTWHRLNPKGNQVQFRRVMRNLEILREENYGQRVEVKHVPMVGINDSKEMMRLTLNYCSESGFRFKFLNFEPIEEYQVPFAKPIEHLTAKLEEIGCVPREKEVDFRGQDEYLPIQKFSYGKTSGVVIEIGCGKPVVCNACYKANEIFLTPRLELKPCRMSDRRIPLKDAIDAQDKVSIFERILESRRYLFAAPGTNKAYWSQRNGKE